MLLSWLYRPKKIYSLIFVAISMLLSEILTSFMSMLLLGRIAYDYLITGGVVSLIVSAVIVYFLRQASKLSEDNENLRREIISREEIEEALRLTSARLESLYENSPVSIWEEDFSAVQAYFALQRSKGVHDFRSYFEQHPEEVSHCASLVKIISVSEETTVCFGVQRKDDVIKHLPFYFTDESLKVFRDELTALSEGKTRFEAESPVRVMDGSTRIISLRLSVVPGDEATLGRVLVSIIDITARKKAEEELRESEERFRMLFQCIPAVAVQGYAMDGTTQYWNEASERIYGYTAQEAIGKNLLDLIIPPEMRDEVRKAIAYMAETGQPIPASELSLMRRDGSRVDLFSSHAIVTRPGHPPELFCIDVDITERKCAVEKLRQSEEFIRNILNTVDEGFIVIDRDYRILTANKGYCNMVGGCSEKIIGRYCYEVSNRINQPCFEEGVECPTHQVFETGTPHTALHRPKDANGNILYVETKAYPIKDDSGVVTSVIEVINNITEKYLLEEERLKTKKLESIGTLAGGIAHDFNNLLQGVFGYISMAKMTLDQKEKSLAMLNQAEEALHMSVNLTTQLLTFAKGGKPSKKLIRLEPTIENAVKFALSGSHTEYILEISPDLRSVEADAGQLAQVIQNIVLNADEAMAGRGTVTISVSNVDIPARAASRLPDSGRFVRIDIQDTGTGISDENMTKIFDPYFTTKQRGSGLGLATSYSIINNHGGVIGVKSELNIGTTFSIYLPASKDAEVETVMTTVSAAVGSKKLRVLLMDDEELVRSLAEQMVSALGHETVSAEDGEKAIDLFRQAKEAGRPFDLVILDLTVKGGMGGEEAIAKIRDIDPDVKAVVSSGYADSRIVANYHVYGFSGVLNKPYRLDDLKDCLNLFVS